MEIAPGFIRLCRLEERLRKLLSLPRDEVTRGAFRAGMQDMLRACLPIAAWGLVTGIALAKTLPLSAAFGMSLLVFAGSAQLAALPLLAAQLPLWVVFFTATVVNLRFVIFSAGIQPHFKTLSLRRRVLLGYFNGDLNFILFAQRYPLGAEPVLADLPQREAYFYGLAICNWLAWNIPSALGIVLADQIPMTWGLDFAGLLALLALGIPLVVNAAGGFAVAAAALVTVVGLHWPYKLNLVAAVIAAIIVGMLHDQWSVGRDTGKRAAPLPATNDPTADDAP
jgi:predicted branched-subunit amino acid permease